MTTTHRRFDSLLLRSFTRVIPGTRHGSGLQALSQPAESRRRLHPHDGQINRYVSSLFVRLVIASCGEPGSLAAGIDPACGFALAAPPLDQQFAKDKRRFNPFCYQQTWRRHQQHRGSTAGRALAASCLIYPHSWPLGCCVVPSDTKQCFSRLSDLLRRRPPDLSRQQQHRNHLMCIRHRLTCPMIQK